MEIDLVHPDSAAQVLDAAQEWLGLPDVLVNNAAHCTHDGFELLDAARLDAHYAVNMRATFLLATEFARRAKALGRLSGHIISMSAGQDWGPMPGELYRVAIPVGAYSTWQGTKLEGKGVKPDFEESVDAYGLACGQDNQLERSAAIYALRCASPVHGQRHDRRNRPRPPQLLQLGHLLYATLFKIRGSIAQPSAFANAGEVDGAYAVQFPTNGLLVRSVAER